MSYCTLSGPAATGPAAHRRRHRRAFTLLEALMAAGILLVIVVAVTSAITAGQQHAQEAQLRIASTLAAEELIGRLSTKSYDELPSWHGHNEPCGTMTDGSGGTFPSTFNGVGRSVTVVQSLESVPGTGVQVLGRTVRVRAFDTLNRTLAELQCFVPQPAPDSIPPGAGGSDDDDDDGGLLGLGILGL